MIKKLLITAAAGAFVLCGIASQSYATDMGPEEITLETTGSSKPKPAFFPHKAHQDVLTCADCHHGMADGKQVPYTDGQEVGKCQSCHNEEVLPGKTAGKEKLDTFKGAGHANCLECHKEIAKKDEAKKDLKKCNTCHKK
jgi:nitrate/TMAO reductase-like tetraheme cytochrome c subunit